MKCFCPYCKITLEKADFDVHFKEAHQQSYRCRLCRRAFRKESSLKQHERAEHVHPPRPWENDETDAGPSNHLRAWERPIGGRPVNLSQDQQDYLEGFRDSYHASVRVYDRKIESNISLNNAIELSKDLVEESLNEFLNHLKGRAAKVTVNLGFLLRSRITGAIRYFWPGTTTSLLDNPFNLYPQIPDSVSSLKRMLLSTNFQEKFIDGYEESEWELLSLVVLQLIGILLKK